MTKSDCFKLPVEAKVLAREDFDVQNEEKLNQTGKSVVNSRVRGKLAESLTMSR